MKIVWFKTQTNEEDDKYYRLYYFDFAKFKIRKTLNYFRYEIILQFVNAIFWNVPFNILLDYNYYHEEGVQRNYKLIYFDPINWEINEFSFWSTEERNTFINKSRYAGCSKSTITINNSYLTS